MKKIFLILMTVLLILPMSSYAGHHNDKSIIFYLDMNVASEKEENLDKFVAYLSETVERTEITDVAPTISSLLNISFPNGAIGTPIEKAIN